ncbi:MAG: cytochrome P450 [bacterium]
MTDIALTRYADVVAALDDALLFIGDDGARVAVRDAAKRALAPGHVAEWRGALEASAGRVASSLPTGRRVDLMRDFAEPWSVSIALRVTGASPGDASPLTALAREVFMAAAHSTDGSVPGDAQRAASELARGLRSGARAAVDVQAFVALTHTLPCTLCGAWLALIEHPSELARLRAQPDAMTRAVEELLRFAGPSRAVFRRARRDMFIGDRPISGGETIALMLSAANRDGARFADPDRLDFERDSRGHLALGRGSHACAGAAVIRASMAIATRALLDAFTEMELASDVEWTDGFAIRGPSSLPVVLG